MVVHSCAANQEPACLLAQLLTMTTTHKFPSLGRPDADLPAVVKDEAVGAAVLKDGVVVLVLVELDAPVESKEINI